jgi:hypothetical protein
MRSARLVGLLSLVPVVGCGLLFGDELGTFDDGETPSLVSDASADAVAADADPPSADTTAADTGGTHTNDGAVPPEVALDEDAAFDSAGAAPSDADACADGGCSLRPIVSGLREVFGLAVDDTRIYFTSDVSGTQTVRSCTHEGAAPIAYGRGAGVATDGTQVFWRDPTVGAVYRCPVAGCATPTLVAHDLGFGIDGPVFDGLRMAWASETGTISSCLPSQCERPTVVARDQGPSRELAGDAGHLVFLRLLDGTVVTTPSSGGRELRTLGEARNGGLLVSGGGLVAWIRQNVIETCSLLGCGVGPTTIATIAGTGAGLATDGRWVVWYDRTRARIEICSATRCSDDRRTLVTGVRDPFQSFLVIRGGFLYFTADQGIGRVPLPASP